MAGTLFYRRYGGGGGLNPFLNRSQVDQANLAFEQNKYNNYLTMLKQLFSQGNNISARLDPNSGDAMSKIKLLSNTAAQNEIAAGNVAQAATGMSSGTSSLARTNAAIRGQGLTNAQAYLDLLNQFANYNANRFNTMAGSLRF